MKESSNTNSAWIAIACGIIMVMVIGVVILLVNASPAEGASEYLDGDEYTETQAYAKTQAMLSASKAPARTMEVLMNAWEAGLRAGLLIGKCDEHGISDQSCLSFYRNAYDE